jgi:thiol-disulfide isomerase/thioredoxin
MFPKLASMLKVPVLKTPSRRTMLLAGVIIVICLLAYGMSKPKVLPYDPYAGYEGYENATSENKPKLIFVYATWCPHCKDILPEMQDLEKKSPVKVGKKEVLVELIESEEKEKINSLGRKINGFPTFLLQTADGTLKEYEGERTRDAIVKFVANSIGA